MCIVHRATHRPIEIMVLETFMPCKEAPVFPQCDLKNCSNDKLRGKGGITCGLANKSFVWFDGRVVYALHSIDFVYCLPFPGGFTYFQSCARGETDCHARLSSPLISSGAEWECLQFWFAVTHGQLKVLLVPNETTSHTLKTYNSWSSYFSSWTLERVPLSADSPYQVIVIKKSLSCLLL